MDVWTYGRMDVWTYGRMDVWTYGRMDVWTYGRMGIPLFALSMTINLGDPEQSRGILNAYGERSPLQPMWLRYWYL
ncbi:MAG: hypothetical protein AB8G05_25755 [Oligoflexales bacterium]